MAAELSTHLANQHSVNSCDGRSMGTPEVIQMMDDQVLVTGALAAAQVLESHRDSSNLSHLAANMSIAAINSVSGERPTTDVLTFWQEGAKQ